jgi:hypothetical protein
MNFIFQRVYLLNMCLEIPNGFIRVNLTLQFGSALKLEIQLQSGLSVDLLAFWCDKKLSRSSGFCCFCLQ